MLSPAREGMTRDIRLFRFPADCANRSPLGPGSLIGMPLPLTPLLDGDPKAWRAVGVGGALGPATRGGGGAAPDDTTESGVAEAAGVPSRTGRRVSKLEWPEVPVEGVVMWPLPAFMDRGVDTPSTPANMVSEAAVWQGVWQRRGRCEGGACSKAEA